MFIAVVFFVLLLSACTQTIENCGDELTLNSWSATLDNGVDVSLSFSDLSAKLILSKDNISDVVISGLCEISSNQLVIFDKKTGSFYAFEYQVFYDCVELSYADSTIKLFKKEV